MSITYRNMLAFITVADAATFAEAAETMHVTQPALSTAIRKMEEQLGGKLFSRTTRRVQLTPEGQQLLPIAKRLINDWDEVAQDMHSLFAMQQGKLTLAAMPSFAESRLPTILREYHHNQPNIRLRILDVVMEEVLDAVLRNRAEIGFTFEPELLDGLDFKPLFTDNFIAVLNDQHCDIPVDGKAISWSQLAQYPFVAMNRGSSVRKWTDAAAMEHGQINIVAETGQLSTLGNLIKAGMGVSVVPQLCSAQMDAKGLRCLSIIEQPIVKRVGVIRATRASLSVAAEALWHQCAL